MQNTSDAYKRILAESHTKEVKLDVYDSSGENFVYSFGMDRLTSVRISRSMFSESEFSVGSCVSGKLNVSVYPTDENERNVVIPKMAMLVPRVRLVSESGETSEWIQKGVFYIDTRNADSLTGILSVEAYDAMMKTEDDYDTSSSAIYPISDISAVRYIANQIGVDVDDRTVDVVSNGYTIPIPIGYSCREVLSGIGVAYGVNFCISDQGKLLAISPTSVPKPTRFLIENTNGFAITFGGVRILV